MAYENLDFNCEFNITIRKGGSWFNIFCQKRGLIKICMHAIILALFFLKKLNK